MRIFDALNDVNNVKSTVKYVKQYGGIADCAVCYTVDPKYPQPSFFERLFGKRAPKPVFTDEYFLDKAKQMAALGADMITIKDMSGSDSAPAHQPSGKAVQAEYQCAYRLPHALYSRVTVWLRYLPPSPPASTSWDTNCWWFSEGTGAPALEFIYIFCKKMGIDIGVNMDAVSKINAQLKGIRKELELSVFGAEKPRTQGFRPHEGYPSAEVDALFDKAVKAAQSENFEELLAASQKIEAYFGFPAPNELVQKAEIPGRHVFEHGGSAQAAQVGGYSSPCHGAYPLGASGCRSAAFGYPDLADRGCSGRELRP